MKKSTPTNCRTGWTVPEPMTAVPQQAESGPSPPGSVFYTLGHSTLALDAFLALLHDAAIDCVADVRRLPGSTRYPQFNQEPLRQALAAAGIGYRHLTGLAGRRGRQPVDPAVNAGWINQSFHHYADYSLQPEFASAFAGLLELGRQQRVAILCAEAVWWRCHRRIISDHLLAAGQTVLHIVGNRTEQAQLTAFARISPDGSLTYPAKVSH